MSRLILVFVVLAGCGDDDGPRAVDAGASDASPPVARPDKRSDLSGAVDSTTGTIVVFGGDDGPIIDQRPSPSFLDETWLFSPAGGWSEVTGASPSARGRAAVGADSASQRMLLFGGRFRTTGATGMYRYLDDLWAFDFSAQSWTELDSGGSGPAPRSSAAAAFDPLSSTYYLFGGDINPDATNVTAATDVWAYASGSWAVQTTTGTAPSPARVFISYTYDSSRNRLVVFGGQVGDFVTPALNDIYALDLSSMTWSQLHDGSGTAPSGRFSAMMSYDPTNDEYLVLGGHADPGVANDLWAFNPSSDTWRVVASGDSFTGAALGCLGNSREIPAGYVTQDLLAPERRSGGVIGLLGGTLWLFGGESDCSDHLDDTWSLDLATGVWSELIEARSGESCARRNDDCMCLCL